jgi:hypothetical protein
MAGLLEFDALLDTMQCGPHPSGRLLDQPKHPVSKSARSSSRMGGVEAAGVDLGHCVEDRPRIVEGDDLQALLERADVATEAVTDAGRGQPRDRHRPSGISRFSSVSSPQLSMLWCVNGTPSGFPVVPLVDHGGHVVGLGSRHL